MIPFRTVWPISLSLVLLPTVTTAQSTSAERNVAQSGRRGVAANNPYVGTQLAIKLPGAGEPSDFLLLAAKASYEVTFKALHEGETNERPFPLVIPVVANFSPSKSPGGEEDSDAEAKKLRDLASSATGISLGLFPYIVAVDKPDLVVTFHSMIAWRMNSLKANTSDSIVNLEQGRFGAGIETQLGIRSDNRRPLTLSAMLVLERFDGNTYEAAFGEFKKSLRTLEVTAVAPITAGLGVLFEYSFGPKDAVRIGLIAVKEVK